MSSKRRLRRKSCDGKKKFATQTEAMKIVWKMKSDGEIVHTYKCQFCKGWHIGHYHRPTHKTEFEVKWYDY